MAGNQQKKDQKDSRSVVTRAPYNFVPFSDTIITRYKSTADLPSHDEIDPNLKSGEIHITMTAQTEIYISDGTPEAHFFRGANGKQMIPGSSVRGMIRNNMYILGFGKVVPKDDVAEQQLLYRKIASKSSGVDADLKKLYHKLLDIPQKPQKGASQVKLVPRKVRAGFLQNHNGIYKITPIREFFRLSRKKYDAWSEVHKVQDPVFYTFKEGEIVLSSQKGNNHWQEAAILCPGIIDKRKPNGIYLFPKADREEEIHISEKDVILYKEDYKRRETVLKEKAFWQLPKNGEEKPVFFAEINGRIIWGMSMFLRIPYSRKLTDGLPKSHKDEKWILDYPKAILGFATKESAYRSRVSFGDFTVIGEAKEQGRISLPPAEPKPSFYAGYTVGGEYYEGDFKLRGYKQYWLKDMKHKDLPQLNGKPQDKAPAINPLPANTRFHGIIKYKNLHEDELGLLLWAIQLEKDCYQSIGMAKPYGFGRIKVSVDTLKEYNFAQRYTIEGLCGHTVQQSDKERIQHYIEQYQNCEYVHKALKGQKDITKRPEIEDFFYIHKKIRDVAEVSYMELNEYRKSTEPLPTLRYFRGSEKYDLSEMNLEDALNGLMENYERRK